MALGAHRKPSPGSGTAFGRPGSHVPDTHRPADTERHLPWSPAPSDSGQGPFPKKQLPGQGSPPGIDWWLLSPGSLTHCPGLSWGPEKTRNVKVTRARLARRGGITAKPRFMGPIIIMKEREKKGTRVRQCPGTKAAALLPKMSSLSTLQISIKHAVLHSFACHLHANDLTPQCTQSPKRLLVLAFLPALPIVLH